VIRLPKGDVHVDPAVACSSVASIRGAEVGLGGRNAYYGNGPMPDHCRRQVGFIPLSKTAVHLFV
jgi:hypothetical protein